MKLKQERLSLLFVLGSLLFLSSATAHAQVTTADLVGTIRDSLRRRRAGRHGRVDQRSHRRQPLRHDR